MSPRCLRGLAGRGLADFGVFLILLLPLALLLNLVPREARAQQGVEGQNVNVAELEQLYRVAEDEHDAALGALEVRRGQFDAASQELADANAAGDNARRDRAFTRIQALGPVLREAERRLQEKAQALREARNQLLTARLLELEGFLAQADSVSSPEDSVALAFLVSDTRNRILELRTAEDPEEVLEPEPDIVIARTDDRNQIIAKAVFLERRADQLEQRYSENGRLLEELRREQSLVRRSGDFLAGVQRFDDPTLPVGPPPVRNRETGDPSQPPTADSLGIQAPVLSLEERIQALVLLQEDLTETIQRTRAKALNFRHQAGGEWA